MKVSKEMLARWDKYARLLLNEHGLSVEKVVKPVQAWDIAHRLDIPKEAYHAGMNDTHIETALKRIFPNAWGDA